MNLAENQLAVEQLVVDLVRVDQRLTQIATSLTAQREPRATAYLRGILECVRDDLLQDAIETLDAASRKSASELREAWDLLMAEAPSPSARILP